MPSAPRERRFRFNAANVFLTYPRCDATPDDLLTHFQSKWDIIHWCISTELHAERPDDDTPGRHLHAWFRFDRKLDLNCSTCFDFNGSHPNIQKPRRLEKVLDYIRKDGIYIESVPEKKPKWHDAVNAASREEFLSLAKQADPKTWVVQHERVIAYADKHYPLIAPYTPRFTDFPNTPSGVLEWLENEVIMILRF